VAGVKQLPQLTPPGQVFAYNNAAVVVAGRLIETLTSKPYKTSLQELVLEPLGLRHSGFFTDQMLGHKIAVSHEVKTTALLLCPVHGRFRGASIAPAA
jgi:CubicO group peptidase (beta-lactamase class C family)